VLLLPDVAAGLALHAAEPGALGSAELAVGIGRCVGCIDAALLALQPAGLAGTDVAICNALADALFLVCLALIHDAGRRRLGHRSGGNDAHGSTQQHGLRCFT
jgi:hypothetical protein